LRTGGLSNLVAELRAFRELSGPPPSAMVADLIMEAAKSLSRAPVEVTVIDRQNQRCFQPLLY
jgi:hypothetical protein